MVEWMCMCPSWEGMDIPASTQMRRLLLHIRSISRPLSTDINPHLQYSRGSWQSKYRDESLHNVFLLTNECHFISEPRCNGCATSVITKWATDISAYIKSLDSTHYVTLGDEGFFNRPGAAEYPYQGGEGIDFEANLKIADLDYGTFHLYTKSWGQSYEWGSKWIQDHGAAGKAAGKSVVLEEYGVPEDGATRETWIKTWHNDLKSAGVDGDQYWQFVSFHCLY